MDVVVQACASKKKKKKSQKFLKVRGHEVEKKSI